MSTGVVTITNQEGFNWHLIQTMAGDQTDGYAGVPGIGIKRAVALLEADGYTWNTVLQAFLDKGLTEEDALRNARLAKILQNDDYDHELQQPKLWTPTASSTGVDAGTTVQAQTD
jgi:DNA polymerase-1